MLQRQKLIGLFFDVSLTVRLSITLANDQLLHKFFIIHLLQSSMQDERLSKLIMEWIPGERRKRGRPRKTWMGGVRAAMKTRHLEEDQWLNRKEWCLGSGRRRQLSQDWKDR